jgi:hypothetical protein
MLVKQFNIKRNTDKCGFHSAAESEIELPGSTAGY